MYFQLIQICKYKKNIKHQRHIFIIKHKNQMNCTIHKLNWEFLCKSKRLKSSFKIYMYPG